MQSKQSSSPKLAIDIDADRYPDYWPKLSTVCKRLTGYRCCYPGCQCSKESGDDIETHHIVTGRRSSSGLWIPIKIYIPGLMLVPLCDRHHNYRQDPQCAHHPSNWFAGSKANKYRDARNNEDYHLILVQGWHEKLLDKYRT
jgi:hypothetical protein